MIDLILEVLSWISILGGLFFMIVGTIGVVRMPDVYTRLHAAGMTDTMGAGLLLLGMCFQAGLTLVLVRLILIYAFLLFTSPISTHALASAALSGGLEPYTVPADRPGEVSPLDSGNNS
ncbi:MAG: monovalent cation/H(+) antiporter subunit G [Gemmatimonadetes bacterium]|jgi:multicomponent Na+:H+ antiporter subunit G|nr:monovalent cation/H(+) antiporter subunit G [Gemmatimonadota bacterium]GIS81035.1 MAG: sodium:proton antiporter [Gammaproteobacteria bacterium]GIT51360.1 MAG: sodium:proton antiporter [Gemmatimonadota bacterium]|tara:strand:+ start:2033 stop:2389 length:357 start_codon:yes stop_codon:yes gene_type:complete